VTGGYIFEHSTGNKTELSTATDYIFLPRAIVDEKRDQQSHSPLVSAHKKNPLTYNFVEPGAENPDRGNKVYYCTRPVVKK
jgi:hypothetical protein